MGDNNLTILIIEENPVRAAILEDGMREAGFRRIVPIADLSNLLNKIASFDPDVIVSAWRTLAAWSCGMKGTFAGNDPLEPMFLISRTHYRCSSACRTPGARRRRWSGPRMEGRCSAGGGSPGIAREQGRAPRSRGDRGSRFWLLNHPAPAIWTESRWRSLSSKATPARERSALRREAAAFPFAWSTGHTSAISASERSSAAGAYRRHLHRWRCPGRRPGHSATHRNSVAVLYRRMAFAGAGAARAAVARWARAPRQAAVLGNVRRAAVGPRRARAKRGRPHRGSRCRRPRARQSRDDGRCPRLSRRPDAQCCSRTSVRRRHRP